MVQPINGSNNNVNFNKFKEGVKKTELTSDKEKSIFDNLDKNKDGKLNKTELDNLVDGKVKNAKGELVTKKYIKIKDLDNGRTLVQNSEGKEFVRAKDGTILKSDYAAKVTNGAVKSEVTAKTGSQKTISFLNKQLKSATTSFNKQLADDGWAGDVADGVSALWGSKNRASKVREDIAMQRENINELTKASQRGEEEFKIKFKQIYHVEYNQQAIDNYLKKPTAENYKKAFGTEVPDIKTRVNEYNESQQTGVTAVKTTAKVAGGVTVGLATGGAGFLALGAAAVGTAATSIVVDETDRANITGAHKDANGKTVQTKGVFKKGTDHGQILKDAAWDGASVLAGGAVGKVAGATIKGATKMATAGRATVNIAEDTALGAAREYAQTGEVSATGVISNAATSGVGSVVVGQAIKVGGKVFSEIKRGLGNADNVTTTTTTQPKQYKVKARTPRSSSATSSTQTNQGIVFVNKKARSTATNQTSTTTQTTNVQNQAHTTQVQKPKVQQTLKKIDISFDTPEPKAKPTEPKSTVRTEVNMSDAELIESLDFKNPENTIATRKALRELESRGYKLDTQADGYLIKDGKSVPILTKEQKARYKGVQAQKQQLTLQKDQVQAKIDKLNSQVKTIKGNQQRLETLDQAIAVRKKEVQGLKSSIKQNGELSFNGKLNRGKAILKMVEEDFQQVNNYRSSGSSSLKKRINDKFGIKTGNNHSNVKYSYVDDHGKKISLDGNTPITDELLDLVHAYQNNSAQNKAKILQKMRDYVSKMEADLNRPQKLLNQREKELQDLTKQRASLKAQMELNKEANSQVINEYNKLTSQLQDLTNQLKALPKLPRGI